MEKKALYNLSYGVFMLSTRSGEKVNGCITNTCMQVANNPIRIAISVLNSNYTCDLIKESGIFALSLLDVNCSFETIKHFGFQSGRDVDKMKDLSLPLDHNDIQYLGYQTKKKEIPQDKKIVGWRCKICNYVYEGSELPPDYTCPLCGHDISDFEPIYERR